MTDLPKAACVLIIRGHQILVVPRKTDSFIYGFPGGKLDEGETFAQAAARECGEETGVSVGGLQEVYHGADAVDFMVYTFFAHETCGEPKKVEGEPHARWMNLGVFMEHCAFPGYVLRTIKAWRALGSPRSKAR